MLAASTTLAKRARSDLERDALAHPSFVHVSEADVLDHVESGLAEAHRWVPAGSPDVEYRARVFSHIHILLGKHCCLCNSITAVPAPAYSPLRTSLPFCKWLCGDFDASSLTHSRTHPLCSNCNSPIVCFSAREHGTGWGQRASPVLQNDAEFVTALHLITHDKCFRKRVEANAAIYDSLRFDPRIAA